MDKKILLLRIYPKLLCISNWTISLCQPYIILFLWFYIFQTIIIQIVLQILFPFSFNSIKLNYWKWTFAWLLCIVTLVHLLHIFQTWFATLQLKNKWLVHSSHNPHIAYKLFSIIAYKLFPIIILLRHKFSFVVTLFKTFFHAKCWIDGRAFNF